MKVSAREVGTTREFSATRTCIVTPALSAVTLKSASASPVIVNTPVELTAIPVGGNEVSYKFKCADGANWKQLQDETLLSDCTWTPTSVGTFTLRVTATETGGKAYESTLKIVVEKPQAVTDVALQADETSPQTCLSLIALSATPVHGMNVEYRFETNVGNGWKPLRDYGPDNHLMWCPVAPGHYSLRVTAGEVGATSGHSAIINDFYITNPPLSSVTLQSPVTSPQRQNDEITLVAMPTGGTRIEYQFQVNDGQGWTTIQKYSEENTCNWRAKEATSYTLMVNAREVGSREEIAMAIPFQIQPLAK